MPLKRGKEGSGIPKAAPTCVYDPRLIAFFAIDLPQGPKLRFPNLHLIHANIRPLAEGAWCPGCQDSAM